MGCCIAKEEDSNKDIPSRGTSLIESFDVNHEEKCGENEETKSFGSAATSSMIKYIDKDQYNTVKVLESLCFICAFDSDLFKKFSLQVSELSNLKPEEKLRKYLKIRAEVSEFQKKISKKSEDNCKNLSDFANDKYSEIDERIELISSLLEETSIYNEEMPDMKYKFSLIPKMHKHDLESITSKLKSLHAIEKDIGKIEKSLPKLNEDHFMFLKLKEIEEFFSNYAKISLNNASLLEKMFGSCEISADIDVVSLQAFEINKDTYIHITESLKNYIKTLQEVENMKTQMIQKNHLAEQLKNLDEKISLFFLNSENQKQAACNRFRRISRESNDFGVYIKEALKHKDINENTMSKTIEALQEKMETFIKTAAVQDEKVLEIATKLNIIDEKFDEIDLKFQELISDELKDMHKNLPHSENDIKNRLDNISEKFHESVGLDLIERFNVFLGKIELAIGFSEIKKDIRLISINENKKAKDESLESIKKLTEVLSEAENQKKFIEKKLESVNKSYEKKSEMLDGMLKSNSDKDIEIINLKNTIATINQKLVQVSEENTRSQDEISDLRKELRDCKKSLRAKENELAELKEH
ncbi:hypothetical protein SteCoe_29195 [Stentor coeruleus]|uniref:Uncharacterized protein n=1 Tax=Stentor coeruleus TaxID=5963 RepID=A0A1R2B6Z2_9CILI|nr:hypothetical protein SteCoe_29195 [Stentor coeruleus]